MTDARAAFIAEMHRQLVTLGCPVHRASLDEAVENALRTAGATINDNGWHIMEAWAGTLAPKHLSQIMLTDGVRMGKGFWQNHPGRWAWIDGQECKAIGWKPLPAWPGSEA